MVAYEVIGATPDFPTLKKAIRWIESVEWTDANLIVLFDDEPWYWLYYRNGKIIEDERPT